MRTLHATIRDGLPLAYVRAGEGGFPLLLVHGWPETKRIWWRNVEPLAAAGFDVIVPDLRGFGDSGLAPDGFYDPAAHARDMHALVHGVLGHARCAAVGGDLGGVVVQDLALRFPGFVVRQCLFNTVLPLIDDAYARAGVPPEPGRGMRPQSDYFLRQGREADALAAELDTPEKRRRYIGEFYGHRFWAAPGTFARADVDFMTEPFADAAKLRAGFGNYEAAFAARPLSEPARLLEPNPTPTLVLYGPEDHVVGSSFLAKSEVAFPNRVGPLVVPGAGHFLQWERAELLNGVLAAFFADLRS